MAPTLPMRAVDVKRHASGGRDGVTWPVMARGLGLSWDVWMQIGAS